MTIVLPYTAEENHPASATGVMENFNKLKAELETLAPASATTDLLQAGVISGADWNFTANIAGGTGKLGSTASTGGLAWVPAAAGGIIRTNTSSAALSALTPSALPASGEYMAMLMEAGEKASSSEATVTVTSGEQKGSQELAEINAYGLLPNVNRTPLRMVIVHNNAGTYEIAAQWDERRYATGVQKRSISTEQSRTSVAFGLMPTPDMVVVTLKEGQWCQIGFLGIWKSSASGVGRATINVGPIESGTHVGPSGASEASSLETKFALLSSEPAGLVGGAAEITSVRTHGQALATVAGTGGFCMVVNEGELAEVRISVQTKSSSGSVTMKNRFLLARPL